ncbi:hypothetical protein [Serratia marcescens]|uniref:hypothetical protein n=1 Tax=Serratia marcescens TaxID=615 RepID=UPI0007456830|nr:hypothetical protein [Serratia marcescens]CVH22908.1 Uncharacterised protein [Serratia marcescens]
MFKKSVCAALLAALCCLPATSFASTCRAGAAAEAGSKAGYEQARRAAEAWASREQNASDQLQNCLSRIRTTTIQLPTFPSLADIMNQVSEKVCQAAVDKINDYIPGTIDPWQEFTGR